MRAETLVSSSCPSRAPLFTPSCCWKCFALRSRNGGPQDFGICLASESYSLSSLPAVGPSLFQPTRLGNYFLISCLCACPAASQSPCFCSATAVTEGPYPMRAPEPSCVYGVLARIMCNVLSTRSRSVLALVALLPLSSISFVPGPSEKETVQANTPQILFQVSCLMLGANKAHVLVTKREHS